MASGEEAMAYSRDAVERAMKSAGGPLAGDRWEADLGPGCRHPGLQSPHHPAPAPPAAVLRLRRPVGSSPAEPLAQAPVAEVQRLLTLYRERYLGFNVRHFHQLARREHGVRFCYAFVKKARQTAGLVAKDQPRGRHRRRREPRACLGELLHLDGSRHRWLA